MLLALHITHQTKNKSSGEEVLRRSQCVVNTCGVLLVWYQYTTAPPALLSITQLYGGQYKDFLTPYNVVSTYLHLIT